MLVDLIVRTLAAHRFRVGHGAWSCRCGVEGDCRVPRQVSERHVAEEVAAAVQNRVAVAQAAVAGAVANVVREYPPGSPEQDVASRCYVAALDAAGLGKAVNRSA